MGYKILKPLGLEPHPEYGYTLRISPLPKWLFLLLPKGLRRLFCEHRSRIPHDPFRPGLRRFTCADCGKRIEEHWALA